MTTDIVLVHGWAYTPAIWDAVVERLGDVNVTRVDLGFFGQRDIPALPSGAVVIGHSLGSMWALKHMPENPKAFIAVNGFDCFYKHVARFKIRAMKSMLNVSADMVLKNFWKQCGMKAPARSMDIAALAEGLDWLMEWDAGEDLKSLSCPVMALAAKDDLIVSAGMSRVIWSHHDLRMTDHGGHLIPLTRPNWCADRIKEML